MSKFGLARFKEQAWEHIEAEIEATHEDAVGDSAIEKLLYTALVITVHHIGREITEVLFARRAEDLDGLLAMPRLQPFSIVVLPQAQLDGWRVDFLVHVLDFNDWCVGTRTWKKLIVECDGHDFHERTKDQAARDRGRDREWQMKGIEVFRFTGSEIWRDPMKCANQILDWAVRSWT